MLGVWDGHGGGYVNDARLDGGFCYETHPEVYTRLQQRYGRDDPAQIEEILWRIDVAALEVAFRQGADFDYSLTRMSRERYEREIAAIELFMEGDVEGALGLLRVRSLRIPFRLREVEVLLGAGYVPHFDRADQVIHWRKP